LPPVPAEIGIEVVEGVISLPGPALQILSPTDKAKEGGGSGRARTRKKAREKTTKLGGNSNLEEAPRGTAVDPQSLVQRSVERSTVVPKLLQQFLLGLSLGKVSRRGRPKLEGRRATTRPRHGQLGALVPHRHHPSPRVPPSGARGWRGQAHPLVSAGRQDILVRDVHHRRLTVVDWDRRWWNNGAVTTVVMAANGAATACCGSIAAAALCGPSLAAVAMLSAARGALDDCRLMGTASSDLNILAGARGAWWAPPCKREDEKSDTHLSKTWRLGSGRLPQGGEAPLSLP
jgi:hypothetical protein